MGSAMTRMTATQTDELWAAIDDQRTRTADLLDDLSPEEWLQPSLCERWTVRHVVAHLTLQRQSVGDVLAFTMSHPRLLTCTSLNKVIETTASIQAETLTYDELVQAIRDQIGSRRHNAFVTARETLTDILVHSQDIAIPLGRRLDMDPVASAIGATRRWDTRGTWMSTVFRLPSFDGYRFAATDIDWTRGEGGVVTGPIGSILLLLTGRRVALEHLHGEGADRLRAAFT